MAQISDTVADILQDVTYEDNRVKLPEQLSRDNYVKTDMVLQNLGGKWNRKAKAHVFDGMTNEELRRRIGDAVATRSFTDRKKELQFFPTPEKVAHMMAQVANIGRGDVVLEPSAGHGAIACAVMKHSANVVAVEIDTTNCQELRRVALGAVQFPGHNMRVIPADFVAWAEENDGVLFDAITMNPPFSGGQDIEHVRAAWSLLRPGGRLVAITSPGWQFKQDRKHTEFKQWLESEGAITDELPAGTFKEAGTEVRTTLIVLQK